MDLATVAERTLILSRPTPGMGFARMARTETAKDAARSRVVSFFTNDALPNRFLNLLTFPGVDWRFERELKHQSPWAHFVGIEREDRIYRAAIAKMPGRKIWIRHRTGPPYATFSLQTSGVRRFLKTDFETLALSPYDPCGDGVRYAFNGAWLDFCGPLTLRRVRAIESFVQLHTHQHCRLALTFLNGKWDAESRDFWGPNRWQAVVSWLQGLGGVVLDEHRYQTVSPMWQFVLDIRGKSA